MKDRNAFKRMVVGLPPSSRDYTGVATAAKLAELLGLGVRATFVEDATLLDAAGLPCVRELRSLEGGWRPIIVAQLTRELESAAAASRQLFAEATKACGIETSFNLARGSAADVISSLATADDIIAIVAPGNPAERVT